MQEVSSPFILAMARMKPRGVLREPLPAAHDGGWPRSLHIVTVWPPAAIAAHVPPVQWWLMPLLRSHGAAIGTVCHSGRRPLFSALLSTWMPAVSQAEPTGQRAHTPRHRMGTEGLGPGPLHAPLWLIVGLCDFSLCVSVSD